MNCPNIRPVNITFGGFQRTGDPLKIKKLERIKHRSTLYELILEGNGKRYLVAYAPKSGAQLCRTAFARAEMIVKAAGIPENQPWYLTQSDKATTAGFVIRYSGRTQRDAIIEGELPFIGDIA